jgi:hypothetical protein
MRFHVMQVGILGRLLPFICHVNQDIKTATVVVAINNSQPLLFVEFQEVPHCGTEVLQVLGVLFTARAES